MSPRPQGRRGQPLTQVGVLTRTLGASGQGRPGPCGAVVVLYLCSPEVPSAHPSACPWGPARRPAPTLLWPEPHLQEAGATTHRFFTSAMPRNAFLGIPRIWFSLRSLNRREEAQALTMRPALHLIMTTKPRQGGRWGLLSLPGGTSLHIVPLEVAFAEMVTRRPPCLPGGLRGWSRTSRPRAKTPGYLLRTGHPILCSATSRGRPLALLSHGDPPPRQGPHHSISRLRDPLPLSSGTGTEPARPSTYSHREGPSALIPESQRPLGASRASFVTGAMDSSRISTKPSKMGVPATPYGDLSSTDVLL